MANQTKEAAGAEDLVIKTGNGANAGNGGQVAAEETKQLVERVAFAEGQQRPPMELLERYESLLDVYAAKFKERMDLNIKQAAFASDDGSGVSKEFAEVITQNPVVGFYKWWDLFVFGPIQFIPPAARPNKILASGEPVFFITFVVTNPLFIDGLNPPTAQTVMAGRTYNLRLETVNLTNVAPGPTAVINSAFPGVTPVQVFLLGFATPLVAEGRPELLEVNVTADVTNPLQPDAAFATSILDIDIDPGFPVGPPSGPHLHVEQPLRCLCYRK
ncbi:hypothetical protein GWN42_02425 [candidate division KSB1 bacterium]|nr:hypothetical protein [candidate division KSB1 bacterium]